MSALKDLAAHIIQPIAAAYGMNPYDQEHVDVQMFCVGEESGEALGAWRRYTGRARRSGTREEYEDEMADVVVSAYVAAEAAGFDLDAAVKRKSRKILSRGWKESI